MSHRIERESTVRKREGGERELESGLRGVGERSDGEREQSERE